MRAKHTCIAAAMAVVAFVLAPVQAHAQGTNATNARIQTLEAQVAALKTAVAALTAKLASVTVESGEINSVAGPHFILTGVNVHIRSGSGRTDEGGTSTGLGNLILGYNEVRGCCPVPQLGDRGGAHTLVIGPGHSFPSIGGFVAGFGNIVSGEAASVLGGIANTASGRFSSVSGGSQNTASGGESSVLGGIGNTASGNHSSVSGGFDNRASGERASVSGGLSHSAPGTYNWAAGSLFQDF